MKYSLFSLIVIGLVACGGPSTPDSKPIQQPEKTSSREEAPSPDEVSPPEVPGIAEDASVFFKNLKDGDEVTSPIKIEMGVTGMEVEPAGDVNAGKGHHHLLINEGATEKGTVVPADDTHIHYGQGQTETEIELSPGEYTLTLQFADGWHRSYGPDMSATVRVVVSE